MWHCALWLSIFALISSVQERMLGQIPDRIHMAQGSDVDVIRLLRIVLGPERHAQNSEAIAKGTKDIAAATESDIEATAGSTEKLWKIDYFLVWVWQAPFMLMHYSWITFLVGYECHLLTPLIKAEETRWTPARWVSTLRIRPPKSWVFTDLAGQYFDDNSWGRNSVALFHHHTNGWQYSRHHGHDGSADKQRVRRNDREQAQTERIDRGTA
jgi:hypothetical protein